MGKGKTGKWEQGKLVKTEFRVVVGDTSTGAQHKKLQTMEDTSYGAEKAEGVEEGSIKVFHYTRSE